MKVERRGARKGLPMLRPEGTRTPCHLCPKIPDRLDGQAKKRVDAADLLPRHLTAFEHYQRCKAVGRFPVDELVERNAGLFARAVAWADRTQRADDRNALYDLIETLAG